jgi:hypothetical protein
MARTRRSEYQKSNRHRRLPLPDPGPVTEAARRLLTARDAETRQRLGAELLARLAARTGVTVPELVIPDAQQPHQREGGRIVYSMQGEYRRRSPSPGDPRVARGGKPRGRIRILNRTPARGDVVRATAFLNTLLHEFCHHHDAEELHLENSFHTAGFYARIRHLREQIGIESVAQPSRRRARSGARVVAPAAPPGRISPALTRLWAIIRDL